MDTPYITEMFGAIPPRSHLTGCPGICHIYAYPKPLKPPVPVPASTCLRLKQVHDAEEMDLHQELAAIQATRVELRCKMVQKVLEGEFMSVFDVF